MHTVESNLVLMVLLALTQLLKHSLPLTLQKKKWIPSLQNGLQLQETIVLTLKQETSHQFPVLIFFAVCTKLLGQIKVKVAEIHNEYNLGKHYKHAEMLI